MTETPLSHRPTIEVRRPRPHAALVVLGGEHDLHSAGDLQRALDQSLASSDHLIVDLSAAEFVDSTVVGVLVGARKRAGELKHAFNVVLDGAPEVERVLDITGVVPMLNVVPTLEQALGSS